MTRISRFELFAVDLPFRSPFRHAAAVRATSGSLFLRVVLDDGVDGWGESLPRPYVSGESRETAFALLRDVILPALIGREFSSLADVVAFLDACDGKAPAEVVPPDVPQSSAWCCVDLALLDAIGRSTNEFVVLGGAPRAGGRPERVRFSGVASSGTGARQVVSLLKLRAFGFRHVKVKVDGEGALRSVRTARRILGRRTDIRVDANMAWDADEASRTIGALRGLGVGSVEQPIPPENLDGLARLVRETGVVIMADEGLTDRGSLQTLIARRACSGANIRISKCGGLVASHARCIESLDAGLTLQVGCQVGESSLLSSAQVNLLTALERRDPGVRFAEGCFGRHLLREDPVRPLVQFGSGGRLPPARQARDSASRWTPISWSDTRSSARAYCRERKEAACPTSAPCCCRASDRMNANGSTRSAVRRPRRSDGSCGRSCVATREPRSVGVMASPRSRRSRPTDGGCRSSGTKISGPTSTRRSRVNRSS